MAWQQVLSVAIVFRISNGGLICKHLTRWLLVSFSFLSYSGILLIRTRLIQTSGLFDLTLWSCQNDVYFNVRKHPVIQTHKSSQQTIRTYCAGDHALFRAPRHAAASLTWQCDCAPAAAPISCCKYCVSARITCTISFFFFRIGSQGAGYLRILP